MNIEEIEVTVLPDGSVQVQVKGAQGAECLEITRDLETALGGAVISRVMTQEGLDAYAVSQPVQEQKRVRRRQKKG